MDTETFDCTASWSYRGDTLVVETKIWKVKNGKGRKFADTQIIYSKLGKDKADVVTGIFAKHLEIPSGANSRVVKDITELAMIELERKWVAALSELYDVSLARVQGAVP
jgi:hypothetical protein